MQNLSDCDPQLLKEAIAGQLDKDSQSKIECHIESCITCQNNLETLAADQQLWDKVSDVFPDSMIALDSSLTQPTVEIQWARDGLESAYEIHPIPAPNISPRDPGGETLQPASHPEMLGRIGGFDIEQVIGRGGMGIVYKGFDTDLNRPVAIKVLAEHLASSGVARQRFSREAKAAAAVIHPNVVPIHSVGASARQPYIVMTLVSGRSLQQHVENQGALPVREVIRIGRQIASGLAAAHREGLVHRDIKPANILLEKDVSRIMITDFGLARAADDVAITQTGWLAGTPHYMSPEQVVGKSVDKRSDLFALGSVLYFMVTGREPFRAELPFAVLHKITHQDPTPVRSISSEVSKTFANIIERLMAKRPDHRFQTADDVERVLTQYLAHLEQPLAQPKPKVRRYRSLERRTKTMTAIGLLIATVIVAWGIFYWRQSPTTPPIRQTEAIEGLQEIHQWQSEVDDISLQLQQLEQSNYRRPYEQIDTMQLQLQALDAELLQLEQMFGSSPLERENNE